MLALDYFFHTSHLFTKTYAFDKLKTLLIADWIQRKVVNENYYLLYTYCILYKVIDFFLLFIL